MRPKTEPGLQKGAGINKLAAINLQTTKLKILNLNFQNNINF